MAGSDIASLHSITSLPPYTPAGSVAFAYTPSGGDAIACMNDTGGPVSAATTGGANTMMSANAVGKSADRYGGFNFHRHGAGRRQHSAANDAAYDRHEFRYQR